MCDGGVGRILSLILFCAETSDLSDEDLEDEEASEEVSFEGSSEAESWISWFCSAPGKIWPLRLSDMHCIP